jgi:hypothetical protein
MFILRGGGEGKNHFRLFCESQNWRRLDVLKSSLYLILNKKEILVLLILSVFRTPKLALHD